MKILLISTNADEAGAPRHVETIVNGLGAEFHFILIFGEEGAVSNRLKSRGHIVHIIREMRTAINPLKDIISLYKIIRLILAHQPDIVHCHSAKAGMLGRLSALICGKKWLYTVHGWGWRGVSSFTRFLIVAIEYIFSKLPRGFYIFVAQDVFDSAVNVLNIDPKNGIVVYNGVVAIDAPPLLSNNFLVVMMPARVSTAKDHQSLISAFEIVNDGKMKLVLCGAGTDTSEFIGFAKALAPKSHKYISFLGERSDIQKFYSTSHIVALISNFEALPLSIIEAMSCSRAVIATKVGGIPELIVNGTNGILVGPRRVDDVAKALMICRDEKVRAELGKQARVTYEERFTEKSMLTSIARTYKTHGGFLNE